MEVAPNLTEALTKLAEEPAFHVVVEAVGTDYYVQFLSSKRDRGAGVRGVLGEAVGNEFLSGPERLSPGQLSALRGLGWREADSNCPEPECEMDHANPYQFWQVSPSDVGQLVGVIVQTFAVYGLGEGLQLETKAW